MKEMKEMKEKERERVKKLSFWRRDRWFRG